MPKAHAQKHYTITGHRDAVYALVPSADSAIFWTGAADGMVVEWDLRNPEQGKLLSTTAHSVYCLAQEQNTLFIAENFEGVHLIDLEENKERRAVKITEKAIFALQIIEDTLWVGSGEGFLTILEKNTLIIKKRLVFSNQSIRSIAFCYSKREVAIGYSDYHIRIVDIDSFELKYTILAHINSVFCLRYSPDERYLLSGSRDAHLKVWETDNYSLHKDIVAHLFTINDIIFNPFGDYFATCSKDKSIKIWKTEGFELIKVIDRGRHAGHGTSVNRLLWTSFEDYLIACSDDRTVSVWKIEFLEN